MNRPEFEREMSRLNESIAALPPAERAKLERLAVETVERHQEIVRASLRGHRAIERLELAQENLREACERLVALAGQAGETLGRVRRAPPPGPGLN